MGSSRTQVMQVVNADPRFQPWQVTQPWLPIDIPWTERGRQRGILDALNVERAPRYQVRDSTGDGRMDTFCNIFLWDASRAAGQEIPHWVDSKGNPLPGPSKSPKGYELDANGTIRWLRDNWTLTNAETAFKQAANHFVVVGWENPRGIGHVAWLLDEGTIAQAGKTNFEGRPIRDGFGSNRKLEFFVSPEPALYSDPEYARLFQESK